MITIVDYGSGNLRSVRNALAYLGTESVITSDPEDIRKASKIILPGVGSFGSVMKELRARKLDTEIVSAIARGVPYLGICIGIQVLFGESEESPDVKGLDILKGKVVRFTEGKVPQIGWNQVVSDTIEDGYAYFVNSFYVLPSDKDCILATTDYYGSFVSAIRKDNITAVQFHPEKSGKYGLDFLRRWLEC